MTPAPNSPAVTREDREAPAEITFNPVYYVTYVGAYPDRGHVYRLAASTPGAGDDHSAEFMSVTIDRDGNVTSHNAFDADFDQMVDATQKIIVALTNRYNNRLKCPFVSGKTLRSTDHPPSASKNDNDGAKSLTNVGTDAETVTPAAVERGEVANTVTVHGRTLPLDGMAELERLIRGGAKIEAVSFSALSRDGGGL